MSFFTQSMNYRDELAANEVEKQRLSDTFLTYLPKNTSGYTYANQLIDIQIPKTEHVVNLAKAYINVKLQIPYRLDSAYTAVSGKRYFVGLMCSATMFDQVQVHSNNKVIHSDTHCQINSRIWQLAKPTHYLNANGFSFINIDDISYNTGFIVHELSEIPFDATKPNEWYPLVYNMRIPLPCLFNIFDNCEAFHTTMLNDNVTLTMQLSTPEKYLCLFETDTNGKMLRILPFGAKETPINYSRFHTVAFSDAETAAYQINEGFKIIAPGHYPTEEEKIEIQNVIANGGWFREFTTTWVQAQDAQFGASTQGLLRQRTLNYNTNVANLYGIIMLAAHNHSCVVFDKPYIKDIEMNASEIWKLANGHTHVEATYDRDNDMYQDLMNVFGQQTFRTLDRFDKAISYDYRYKGEDNKYYRRAESTVVLNLNNANDTITGLKSYVTVYSVRTYESSWNYTDTYLNTTDHTLTLDLYTYLPLNAENTYTNSTITITIEKSDLDADAPVSRVTSYAATSTATPVNGATYSDSSPDANHSRVVFTISSANNRTKLQDDKTFGSYIQYYRFAPSGQMGYSGDYFSNQINYKYQSCYEADGDAVFTKNNHDNATMFCCCQTLSFLVFKEGGIDVINPFSEELDVRVKFSSNYHSYAGTGHGLSALIPGLISPVTSVVGKGIGGLRKLVKENRNHLNATYAYSQLGKDGYEKHKEIIEGHSTMPKRKFKKFINGLKQMESQTAPHGLEGIGKGLKDAGTNPYGEEIAEPATFDELNLQPFVQSYSADLADCEYKNQLVLDYKYRLNTVKLRLSSFGSEAAMSANNYHGRVGDWFRRVGRKIKGWYKKDGRRIIKNAGRDLLGVAKEYAAKIATGEMSLTDVRSLKPELKQKILAIVQNNTKGTALEGVTGDALNWYKKWKSGDLKWTDIPTDMIARVKELDMKEKSGSDHGVIVRHGFVAGPSIKPSVLYSVQKQRMKQLMGKNPMEMRRRDLRKLYRFKYLKENPPIDTSRGRLAELLRQRYPHIGDASVAIPSRTTASVKDYGSKWRKDKQELVQTEHGIAFLDKVRRKAHKRGIPKGDARWSYQHKKFKKWQQRQRAVERAKPETASSEMHGIEDFSKMQEIWKKYKKQYKPKQV